MPSNSTTEFASQWESWTEGRPEPDVLAHLESEPHSTLREELDLLLVDLFERHQRGCPRPIEEYFASRPRLAENSTLVVELVAEEFGLREMHGDSPTVEEYLARFPGLGDSLRTELERSLASRGGDDGAFHAAEETLSVQVAAQETATYVPTVDGEAPPLGRFGDYDLIEELGRGGMGVVYKAYQRSLKRLVALKMIRSGELAGRQEIDRFLAEARAAAQLDHPGIVPVFEVGEAEGRPFFSMGYVEGHPLSDEVRNGPLPPERAADLTRRIAEAVQYAHDRGIVHRDLKPANVLIDTSGTPRVMDFGLAKVADEGLGMTVTGDVLGTPAYMPPEQARGLTAEVGPHSDVYSLGALLYCLLTGRPPFVASSLQETLQQVVEAEPVAPRQLNPSVPRDLETICLKCLEKTAASRYGSALEVQADLERYVDGRPITARPVGRLERAWRWCCRHPATAIASCVGVIAMVSLSALFAALGYQSELQEARDAAVELAGRETQLRQEAEQLTTEADEQRVRAEAAESDAETARSQIERILNAERLRAVAEAVSPPEINVARARLLLDECPGHLRQWDWRYLDSHLRNRQTVVVEGVEHPWPFRVSPDGKLIAARSSNAVAQLFGESITFWEADTGRCLRTLTGATPLKFSPDGTVIAYAGGDGIRVANPRTGEVLKEIRTNRRPHSICFSPDGKRLAGNFADRQFGRRITVWDVVPEGRSGETIVLPGTGACSNIAYGPDGPRVVFGNALWDVPRKHRLWPVPPAGGHLGELLSEDGVRIAAHHQILGPKLIEPVTGRVGAHLDLTRVTGMCFSADGQLLAAGNKNEIRVWSTETGDAIRRLSGTPGEIPTLRFGPGDTELFVLDQGKIEVRSLEGIRPQVTFSGHNVAVSPDGSTIASFADGQVEVREALTGNVKTTFNAKAMTEEMCFSPDGKKIVGADRVWEASTGRVLFEFRCESSLNTNVCFSPDGTRFASGHQDSTIRIWDASNGRELRVLPVGAQHFGDLAFGPDGKWVACGLVDVDSNYSATIGRVVAWEAATGKQLFQVESRPIGSACFTIDGQLIAMGQTDGTITICDASMSGGSRDCAGGHNGYVGGMSFHPDGSKLATAGRDGVKVWDVATGRETLHLSAEASGFDAGTVQFSGDGSKLVAEHDGIVSVWIVQGAESSDQ